MSKLGATTGMPPVLGTIALLAGVTDAVPPTTSSLGAVGMWWESSGFLSRAGPQARIALMGCCSSERHKERNRARAVRVVLLPWRFEAGWQPGHGS